MARGIDAIHSVRCLIFRNTEYQMFFNTKCVGWAANLPQLPVHTQTDWRGALPFSNFDSAE